MHAQALQDIQREWKDHTFADGWNQAGSRIPGEPRPKVGSAQALIANPLHGQLNPMSGQHENWFTERSCKVLWFQFDQCPPDAWPADLPPSP